MYGNVRERRFDPFYAGWRLFRNFSGELTLAHRPADIKGRRFNDGKVGPDGCYYVGTTDDNHEGAFYRLSGSVLTELFDHCGCSNGLDWSEDTQKALLLRFA